MRIERIGLKHHRNLTVRWLKIIDNALANPRRVDNKLVDAAEARRILDRLYGYEVSPVLWKKVMPRLSAGRVQSVAVRLIADREKEIEQFKPVEYWTIQALLHKNNPKAAFLSFVSSIGGKKIEKEN